LNPCMAAVICLAKILREWPRDASKEYISCEPRQKEFPAELAVAWGQRQRLSPTADRG
jgi:hypothetical protein